MTDTDLEIECRNCGEKFWYSGEKNYPETVECPSCDHQAPIPEDG